MDEIIVRKRTFFTYNVSFSFSLDGQWSMALKKGVQFAWVELEKGREQCTPFILGFLFYLKKIVLKCVFQSLDSGCKFLQSSSNKRYYLHVHEPKCLPSKKSLEVTLNHSQILLLSSQAKTQYNIGQNMLRHITKIFFFFCHPAKNGNHRQMNA